jgi:serine/threonine protein kinase
MAPSPGPSLLGRLQQATAGEYEVLREIGRGGMAAVFLAKDIRLDRHVALKVMLPELIYKEGMAQRFRREAMTAAKLEHPNIVVIYSVREAADLLFFAMKYVEGSSLAGIIRGNAPLPVEVATEVLLEIAAALSFAHGAGVVHRDVKPGNVLLGTNGSVKLTDFGIAKALDNGRLTPTTTLKGKLAYMAPEVVLGLAAIDTRADLFSLGIVLYELVTLEKLFRRASDYATIYALLHDRIPSLSELRREVPAELDRIGLRALARDPDDRYPTARALCDDLHAFAAGSGASTGSRPLAEYLAGLVADAAHLREETPDTAREEQITIEY